MSDESIFENSATQDQVGAASDQPDVKEAEGSQDNGVADLLAQITTEDGRQKYNSLEDAINSIPHSQKHISTLEQENKKLKEAMEALQREQENRKKVEDTMDAVKAPEQPQAKPEMSQDELVALIDQVMGQKKQQETAESNQATVANALLEKFGDRQAAEKAYIEKAKELDIPVEMLNEMARKSPKAALAYFGTAAPSVPAKTTGSMNTAALSNAPKQSQRGKNPLLSGSMADMQAEWNRIKQELGVQ